ALLKRQIELSVSLSVSEARRSFQSVASNGEERARNSIVTLLKKKFFTISLIHYLSIVYICRNNICYIVTPDCTATGCRAACSGLDSRTEQLFV
ncbi:hypothetical protein SFRURICE_012713, partial [Spodoptera frugiperda]